MQWIQARNRCLSFLTGSADGILCFNSPVCLAERRWFAGLPRCRGNFAPAVLMDILKFRSQLFGASEQLTLHLRLVQNTLTRWGRTVAEKPRSLRQALRARENYLLASSRDAILETNGKISKFRSQLRNASEQLTLHLRPAQNRLIRWGRMVAEKPRHAIVVTNGKISKFRSQLLNTSEQLTLHLRLVQNTLTRWGRTVAEKPRSLRQALRARENYLQTLLASSRDAIVVTNVDRRVVAANPKALDLFGVSETNMEKFTIDVFLLHGQSLYFTGHGSRPMRREKRHGECKIRRLDGSLRVVEYIFVADFVPNRHLYRFRNVKTTLQRKSISTFDPIENRVLTHVGSSGLPFKGGQTGRGQRAAQE